MSKAIQCPSCGRKHRVATLPDAPTFKCENCGQPLKVPAQFRPSVMESSRHVRQPDPPRADATSVLPEQAAAAAFAAESAAARAPGSRRRPGPTPSSAKAESASPDAVSRLLRVVAWVVAMVLGLVVTLWIARTSGWLSGDRLVDVFTQEGWARYIRVVAVAPVWALFTTLLLTLFLEGGRALARRRAEKLAESEPSRRGGSDPLNTGGGGGPDRDADPTGDARDSRRAAARRAVP
ncbi:MAG TPA: hypothetical protein VKI01_12645 [Acidimicrobiia bacterium]|nr:hypothetical protein [Acidimicrobiia bacterium]